MNEYLLVEDTMSGASLEELRIDGSVLGKIRRKYKTNISVWHVIQDGETIVVNRLVMTIGHNGFVWDRLLTELLIA